MRVLLVGVIIALLVIAYRAGYNDAMHKTNGHLEKANQLAEESKRQVDKANEFSERTIKVLTSTTMDLHVLRGDYQQLSQWTNLLAKENASLRRQQDSDNALEILRMFGENHRGKPRFEFPASWEHMVPKVMPEILPMPRHAE